MEMTIREQAAHWITELPDAGATERSRFAAWLRESPRHVEEFLFFNAMWQELDHVDPEKKMDLERLIAETTAHHTSKVIPLHRISQHWQTIRQLHPPRWLWATSVAILIAGLLLAWPWLAPTLSGTHTYATTIGEQRALKLDDGSFVHLNARSRLQVRYSREARDIDLTEGEALFIVARDATRPFRVHAGKTVVQAVGTQFNVYRRANGTTVSVIEGTVKVQKTDDVSQAAEPQKLAAGEQANVQANGRIVKQATPTVKEALAWRQRRLVFKSNTLAEVAAEFNRYNALQIEVQGDSVRAKRLIGTFDADDPESLGEFLSRESDLRVQRTPHALIIAPR